MMLASVFSRRSAAQLVYSAQLAGFSHTAPSMSGFYWRNGEPLAMRDVGGARNWIVPVLSGASGLRLLVRPSTVSGAWSTVSPASGTPLDGEWILSAMQSADGKVHILTTAAFGVSYSYSRLTLTRDGGGAVTGFSVDVSGVAVCTGGSGSDGRGMLLVATNASGVECVVVLVNHTGGSGMLVRAQMAASTTPANSSAFTRLDGAAGVTTVADFDTGDGSNHEHNALCAQIASTRAIIVAMGRVPAEGNTAGSLATVTLTASGGGWSVGSQVARTTGQMAASMCGASDRVLILANYCSASTPAEATGLSIDSLDSAGTYSRDWVAAPSSWSGNELVYGAISCSPDCSRIYVAHQVWNFLWTTALRAELAARIGGAWSTASTTADSADGDCWGYLTSTGGGGLLVVRLDDTDSTPWTALITEVQT